MDLRTRIEDLLARAKRLRERTWSIFTWQPSEQPPELPANASDEQRQLHGLLLAMDATIPASDSDSSGENH